MSILQTYDGRCRTRSGRVPVGEDDDCCCIIPILPSCRTFKRSTTICSSTTYSPDVAQTFPARGAETPASVTSIVSGVTAGVNPTYSACCPGWFNFAVALNKSTAPWNTGCSWDSTFTWPGTTCAGNGSAAAFLEKAIVASVVEWYWVAQLGSPRAAALYLTDPLPIIDDRVITTGTHTLNYWCDRSTVIPNPICVFPSTMTLLVSA